MMTVMFGFMDYMIISKWLTDWTPYMEQGYEAPNIIQALVAMFLTGGKLPVSPGQKGPAEIVNNQPTIMITFVIIAFSMVPLMLLVKPFYESSKNKSANVDDELEMVDVK